MLLLTFVHEYKTHPGLFYREGEGKRGNISRKAL